MKATKYFAIATVMALFAASSVMGLENSILLKGVVAPIFEWDFAVEPGNDALNLDGASGNFTRKIASITERSNYKGGYTVSVTSTNAGALKDLDATNTDSVTYNLTYGGASVTFAGAGVTTLIKTNNGKTGRSGIANDVVITTTNLSVDEMKNAGTYQDTLTFLMVQK
jgi:hypothetical protein